MGEYEQWLTKAMSTPPFGCYDGSPPRPAGPSTFPPPPDFDRWSNDAVDELQSEMIARKGGVAFLIETLISVDNQGRARRNATC